jgi:hypothetical protein
MDSNSCVYHQIPILATFRSYIALTRFVWLSWWLSQPFYRHESVRVCLFVGRNRIFRLPEGINLHSLSFYSIELLAHRFISTDSCTLWQEYIIYCVMFQGKCSPATCRADPKVSRRYSCACTLFRYLKGVVSERHFPAALPPSKRSDTPCTGGWIGLWIGLDESEKTRSYRGPNLWPYRPLRVAIRIVLSGPPTVIGYPPNKFAEIIGKEKQFANIFILSDKHHLSLPDRSF